MTAHQVSVTGNGIDFPDGWDCTVDVLFDGTRAWSFSARRQPRAGDGRRHALWPADLRRFLRGSSEVVLRDHVADAVLASADVAFDESPDRVRVVDAKGLPLALDKWDKLVHTFENKGDTGYGERLLDDLDALFAALTADGVDAYLSYGTLLGAVRSGGFIAHDTDGDISYVSKHENPADIALEGFAIERALHRRGWGTHRLSGGWLQVWAPGRDEQAHIDVFTAYVVSGHVHVDRWIRGPGSRADLLPVGTVTLEGRTFPGPAAPERVLELTYGPHWRVPDPSFKFSHPRSTRDRARGWLGRQLWINGGRPAPDDAPVLPGEAAAPSSFAEWVAGRVGGTDHVLELGCRSGVDAVHLASMAASVHGIDHMPAEIRYAVARAEAASVPATFARVSLYDLRRMVATGAQLARRARGGGRVVIARGVLEHLHPESRDTVWDLARTALGGGGRFLLESTPDATPAFVDAATTRGATVAHQETTDGAVRTELAW